MNISEDVKLQRKLRKELIEAMCKFINDNNLTTQFLNKIEKTRSHYGNLTCYMDNFVYFFCMQRIKTSKLRNEWSDTVDKVLAPYFTKYLKDKKMYYTYRKYVQLQLKEGNFIVRIYNISPRYAFRINEDLKKWRDIVSKIITFDYDYLYKCMIK
jgi:hypothetical protein